MNMNDLKDVPPDKGCYFMLGMILNDLVKTFLHLAEKISTEAGLLFIFLLIIIIIIAICLYSKSK